MAELDQQHLEKTGDSEGRRSARTLLPAKEAGKKGIHDSRRTNLTSG